MEVVVDRFHIYYVAGFSFIRNYWLSIASNLISNNIGKNM